MADSAAESKAGDAGVPERPTWRCEAVPETRGIEVLPERPAPARRGAGVRIDDAVAHEPQIHDDAAVADAVARDAVPASTHRQRKILITGKCNRCHHVADVERPHNQLRPAVDH